MKDKTQDKDFVYNLTKKNISACSKDFESAFKSSFKDEESFKSAQRWIEMLILDLNLMWETGLQKSIKEMKG